MLKNYVPLHNHSHYSTLDGYATIDEYIKAAKENDMIGIGLCDHGTASGLYKFITRTQKAGLIPVPGIEFYVAPENPEGAKHKGPIYYGENGKRAPKYDVSNGAYTHLTVFAYNNKGLENLFKLTSLSWNPEHYYFKPRIDTNMLAEYSEGLIVTTGCPSSEVSRRFLLGQDDKAYEYTSRLKSIFGDNLYVEVMNHKMKDDELERILLPKQIKLAKDLNIKIIATNDSHYAFKKDAGPHERVLALSTKSTMEEKPRHEGGKRFAFSTEEYHIKTYDEMLEIYPEEIVEEALANTIELTEKCKAISLNYDSHLRPEIEVPEGYTEATYLQKLIFDGFNKKRGHESDEIKQESIKRIKEEFEVLHSNDFISYFLVVHDYIDFAHKKGIGVGAGRGCFIPGSKVETLSDGMKNIEEIKPGDKVQTHDLEYRSVKNRFEFDVKNEDMVKIVMINGSTIDSTADHLIFHKDKGYTKAEDLVVGDVLFGPKSEPLDSTTDFEIIDIEYYKYTGKVYDIHVEDVHNYTVSGVTVHNSVGGSEIAYVLDISNTDPIRFDLLFERFLSPGRGSLYEIKYTTGETEEIPVSAKKEVTRDDRNVVVYVHELYPGDMVNFRDKREIIEEIYVKVPGSAPDVDTDFHTEGREEVIQYCVDKYGKENVANIVTFGTFMARKAFKSMATIYKVPFGIANKISNSIIPTSPLKDMIEPTSPVYGQGVEFRQAIEEDEKLQEVVDMAIPLHGRISETGVHPCGLVISNQPLAGIVPLQVRQNDGKVITQWEYPELEALGLIKMDMLGLDLINTIQQTLENIKLTNESAQNSSGIREIPNMRDIIQGPMDDAKTYENLREGNTIGIFQLGGEGVRELLKRAKPTEFMDIATITALYRPGPMSVQAHNEWADRKNGLKDIVYVDKQFSGTVVEDILNDTEGVIVYQEQLMAIATRYAGMSPYESDVLRSAMGKKKMDIMLSLKPKFIQGAVKKGSTEKLANLLWDTMVGFAEYGFNRSHSVSYAINIYQTIYLKTHYPSEFMAALIQQGFGDANKVREYIQEAQRMKLKIGPVDINNSQVQMASTGIAKDKEFDIVFGFSGVKQMNSKLAQAIVDERNKNGLFKSVGDFIVRMAKVHPLTSSPLQNLALAGAFDSFGVSRKMVVEKSKMLIGSSSAKKVDKGVSLFSMLGPSSEISSVEESIEIHGEDYPFNELIKRETDAIGMFVSGHPTSRLGHISKMYNPTTISKILSSNNSGKFNVLGTITQIASKTSKAGNRSIALMIDDGTDTSTVFLPKNIVQSIEKYEELERIKRAKENGTQRETDNPKILEILNDSSIEPIELPKVNEPFLFTLAFRGWGRIGMIDIKKLNTAPDGSLPYEFNVASESQLKNSLDVIKKHFDNSGFYVKINSHNGSEIVKNRVKLSLDFIMEIENVVGKENIVTSGI